MSSDSMMSVGRFRLERASEPNGSRVRMIVVFASVPLRRLVESSGYDKLHWSFVDGWLICAFSRPRLSNDCSIFF